MDMLLFFWKIMAIFLGGFVVILGVMDLINGIKSKKWPYTMGKIVYSRNTSEGAIIRYKYMINDIEYVSDKIFFNKWPTTKSQKKF